MENQDHWLDHEPEEIVREILGNLESELLIIEVTMELNDQDWMVRQRQLYAQAVPIMRQWLGWYEMRGLIEHDVGPLELELLVLLDLYHQGLTAFEEVRDLQRQDLAYKEQEVATVRAIIQRRGIRYP
jgi:hypothetical protein